MSFRNNRSFLSKIDSLPSGGPWQLHFADITGDRVDENDNPMKEKFELWYRNPELTAGILHKCSVNSEMTTHLTPFDNLTSIALHYSYIQGGYEATGLLLRSST